MDDPFGCLQNEKISTKKILPEFLEKRNELYLCLPTKKNRCTSCEEQLFNVVNEFVVNVQNVVECLNMNMIMIMMMNSYKKKIGEEFFAL